MNEILSGSLQLVSLEAKQACRLSKWARARLLQLRFIGSRPHVSDVLFFSLLMPSVCGSAPCDLKCLKHILPKNIHPIKEKAKRDMNLHELAVIAAVTLRVCDGFSVMLSPSGTDRSTSTTTTTQLGMTDRREFLTTAVSLTLSGGTLMVPLEPAFAVYEPQFKDMEQIYCKLSSFGTVRIGETNLKEHTCAHNCLLYYSNNTHD